MEVRLTPSQERELAALNRKYNDLAEIHERIMKRHEKNKKSAAYIHAKQDWIKCRSAHANAKFEFIRNVQRAYVHELEENNEDLVKEAEKQIQATVNRIGLTRPDAEFLKPEEIAETISGEMGVLLGELNTGNREKVYKMIIKAADETVEAFAASERYGMRAPLPPMSVMALMNDKVNNELTGRKFEHDDDGDYKLSLRTNQAPRHLKDVIVGTLLTLDSDAIQYDGPVMFTAFDNAVYCAVSTCYHYFQNQFADVMQKNIPMFITPQEIWRMVNGITSDNSHATEAQMKRVCESMDKMCRIRATMNLEDEVKNNYIQIDRRHIASAIMEDSLINAVKLSFRSTSGHLLSGYRVNTEPILYSYNYAKDHLLFVPFDLLDTSGSIENTVNTIEFRIYLLQQIQLMNNNHRDSNRILYSTVYEKTGVPSPEKRILKEKYNSETAYKRSLYKENQKDRDKIHAILADWTKKKFIKEYSVVKEGKNKSIGVEIILQPCAKRLCTTNQPK